MTQKHMAIDLLREEVKSLVLNSVLNEVRVLILSLIRSSSHKLTGEHTDIVILLLLLWSKKSIFHKLRLSELQCFEPNRSWLLKAIEADDYPFLGFLDLSTHKYYGGEYNNVAVILIENLVIKISNVIAYQLISNEQVSNTFLKLYSTDSVLVRVDMKNMKSYLGYESYLNFIFLNLKKYYTHTYYINIMTKYGLVTKEVYIDELPYKVKSSLFEVFIIKCTDWINFLLFEKNPQKF